MSTATLTSDRTNRDARSIGTQPLAARFLLAAGLFGPLFFFVVVIVEGVTQPGYNAWHHVASTLALGPGGWVLSAGLAVLGLLLLCFAVGLRMVLHVGTGSTWVPILIAICGLAAIGEAIFVSDPALGYPAGQAATSTLHGSLHNVLSVAFDFAVIAACIVLARRFAQAPGSLPWVMFSVAIIIVAVVLQVLAVPAFLSNDPDSPFGLIQRLQLFTLYSWLTVMALRLLTRPASVLVP
jgi:hypothetical protein